MLVSVLNKNGKPTDRTVDLPNKIFQVEPNNHVLYLYVKQYLAAQRQGTSQTKARNQVQGSGRKVHRQKGTGGSRKGNIRNPLYKGGGRIFGPQLRDYSFKLNKKEKTLARASVLSLKAKEKSLMIVENLQFSKPKTSKFLKVLKALKAANKRVLFLVGRLDENLFLSLRNLPKVKSVLLQDFNAYDALNSDVLILTESSSREFITSPEKKVSSVPSSNVKNTKKDAKKEAVDTSKKEINDTTEPIKNANDSTPTKKVEAVNKKKNDATPVPEEKTKTASYGNK